MTRIEPARAPELSIRGAGQEDRSSGNENAKRPVKFVSLSCPEESNLIHLSKNELLFSSYIVSLCTYQFKAGGGEARHGVGILL